MNAKLAKSAKGTTHAVLRALRNFAIFVIPSWHQNTIDDT